MTIIFTEHELEWINKEPFNWTVKQGCPESIRKALEKKLKLLYSK
jgi:hypothetical protein